MAACGDKVRNLIAGFCCCACFATPLTLLISLNVLFTDWLTSFNTDRGSTVAVQATCMGVTLGGGVLAGIIERKVGARVTIIAGSVLASVGLFSGGFAPNLPALIFCVGVLAGSGFCLVHLSSLSCAMARFPRRAAFVSSVMTCVSGSSHLGTPLLYRYMSDMYTWRGTLIVASGIALHTIFFGLLLTSPLLSVSDTPPKSPPSGSHPIAKDDGGQQEGDDQALLESETRPRAPTSDPGHRATHPVFAAAESQSLEESARKSSPTTVDGNTGEDREPESGEMNHLLDAPDDEGERTGEFRTEGQEMAGSQEKGDFIPAVDGKGGSSSQDLSVAYSPSSQTDRILDGTVEPLLTQDRYNGEIPADHLSDRLSNCDPKNNLKRSDRADPSLGTYSEHSDSELLRLPETCRWQDSSQPPAPPDLERNTTDRADRGPRQRCLGSWRKNAESLANPIYVSVLLCVVLVLSSIICFVFLVLDLAASKGWTLSDGVFLNFVFVLSTLLFRLLLGLFSLWKRVHCVALLVISALIGSFGVCGIGQVSDFHVVCFLYACMAAGYGGIVGMFPPAVLIAVGPNMCAVGIGLVCTVEGVLDGVAGIATGTLVDILGSYRLLSLVYGLISVSSSVLLLVVFLCHKPKQPVSSTKLVSQT